MRIEFKKPVVFEGKTYNGVELKLDALTGRDLISAESEAAALMGRPAIDVDKTYQACVAAKSSGVPVDMLLGLPAKDFNGITSAVQSFLLEA